MTEGMDAQDCPTPEQWARIKSKIEALEDGKPGFIDPVQPYPIPSTIYWSTPHAMRNLLAALAVYFLIAAGVIVVTGALLLGV